MIDMLKLSIPFKDEYLYIVNSAAGDTQSINIKQVAEITGLGMCSGGIYVSEDGIEVSDLQHAFGSLPSHFTGMAFKIYQGTPLRPACVEIKASPAKLIQGHNVFGSTNIETGAQEMFSCLLASNGDLFNMLDLSETALDMIDVTYSANMENETLLKQAISHFKNVSNGQMRTSVKNEFDTTCYFNKGSRHVDRKVYMKYPEFTFQMKKLEKLAKVDKAAARTFDKMSDPRLQNFARNLLRFEARCKRRWLDSFKSKQEYKYWDTVTNSYKTDIKETTFPVKLSDAIKFQNHYEKGGESLIADMWKKAFNPLLKSLEGTTMNVYDDDSVLQQLITAYETTTKLGNISHAKAKRLHTFYRAIVSQGFTNLKSSFSTTRSFNMNLKDLTDIGLQRASLQQMTGNNNVLEKPVLQVVNVNFGAQFPSWYVEDESPITAMIFGTDGHKHINYNDISSSKNSVNARVSGDLDDHFNSLTSKLDWKKRAAVLAANQSAIH